MNTPYGKERMEGVGYISGGKCSTGKGALVKAAETKQVFCPMYGAGGGLKSQEEQTIRTPKHQNRDP